MVCPKLYNINSYIYKSSIALHDFLLIDRLEICRDIDGRLLLIIKLNP